MMYLQSDVCGVSKRFNMHNVSINNNSLINQCNESQNIKHSVTLGDDAFFITQRAIGVADGVSGWEQNGMSSAFSNSLLFESMQLVNNGLMEPTQIIDLAYKTTLGNVIGGSCTVCIAVLNDNILNVGNLGDSGLVLIRDGEIIKKTDFTRIEPNMPYQLGKWPPRDNDKYNRVGSRICDIMNYQYLIKPDDIIVIATDGIFDNMSYDQILNIVNVHTKLMSTELVIAQNIVKNASASAAESLIKKEKGEILDDTVDDMTVIVTKIVI